MTDQIADRLLYFIRTSLYEGKQPDDEGYYVFTRKELVEGAEISASSFDKTIAWKLEGYCSDVSYDRGKLKFKVANKKAEEWLKVPPLDYRLVYEYRQGGYRRVPGNKVIFDAFPHAWTPEQITEYNKAHGIFKSDIGDAFNESDWRYAVKNGERCVYRLASGNYLEVSREQYPVNPREYATGLGKFYLFQKGVHMDESPDLGNLNDFCRKYGLSHPKFHNTNVGPCTADSSKGILLIPIRSFNYHLYHFGNPTYPCDNYFDRAAYGAAVVMQDNINAAGLDVSIKEQRGLEQILEILKKELYDFNAYCHRLIYEMRIYDKDGIEIPEYHRGHYAAWVETGEGDFAISYMLKDMGILDEIHAMGDDIAENLGNIRIDYAI